MKTLIFLALLGYGGYTLFKKKYLPSPEEKRMKEICLTYHTMKWPETVKKYGLDGSRAYCDLAPNVEVVIRGGSFYVTGTVDNGLGVPWTGSMVIKGRGSLAEHTLDVGTLQPGEIRSFNENVGSAAGVSRETYTIDLVKKDGSH